MAIDNLNFYNTWLPAGQQTDRYSSQPWCLRSKNLDIFSSSKSVKATAWSNPVVASDADIIAQDWKMILKTDWKVYERNNWVDTLIVDPSQNFPVYQVCYTWKNGTYANAQRWTPQSISAKYNWDEWESLVVFTDRASFVYNRYSLVFPKTITHAGFTYVEVDSTRWYKYSRPWGSPSWPFTYKITVQGTKMAKMPFKVKGENASGSKLILKLNSISVTSIGNYYYDLTADDMAAKEVTSKNLTWTWNFTDWLFFDLDVEPNTTYEISMWLESDQQGSWTTDWWYFYVDMNGWEEEDHYMKIDWVESAWDYQYYYTYLPLRDRELTDIGVYGYSNTYWMKWDTFQYLYKWVSSFVDGKTWTIVAYDFVTDMGWPNDPEMDIIWMVIWNEQVYMIGNMWWNWYIIPCDLTWWRWTPYIAYGCTFLWVTNIDYLMYLVGEDRGISKLWAYNWQELVSVLWGSEERTELNLIKNEEQYSFDWNIINWRWNLMLSTRDNRVFQYGQTYWGKWWAFVYDLGKYNSLKISELRTNWNDLELVIKDLFGRKYIVKYQDDIPMKNYNTEWMAEYPIQIWNHLLEKEESDLYASYILPKADTKLEFWGCANHYHFRTFTSWDTYTFSTIADYKMKGCTWNYALKFIEKNDNQYTFRLEGDLPIQTTNDISYMKITDANGTELITYSDFNHFRKIGEITTTEYQEWEFRFHNLNNKLELPKSHSLQIMVKWKGTANYTPELFALDLVANQRDRW